MATRSRKKTTGSGAIPDSQPSAALCQHAMSAWSERTSGSIAEALLSRAEALVRELCRELAPQGLAALAEAWAVETEEAGLTSFAMLGLPLEIAQTLRGANFEKLANQAQEFLLLTAQLRAERQEERLRSSAETELGKLREHNRRLELLERRRNEFNAAFAHELRTPLMALGGCTELLAEQLGTELPVEYLEYLRIIGQSVNHMRNLLDAALDLAKLDAGAIELCLEAVDLGEIISEAQLVIQPMLTRKQQAFTVELPAALPLVLADPLRLRQILVNLFSNASKFTPESGSISVTGSVSGRSRKRMVLAIQDNGPGIPPDKQKQVFERFWPGAINKGGTGLGLTITKALAELHGSKLKLDSQPGQGTCFTFTLPLAPEQPPPGEQYKA
ncbi:MAG: HAMP domain-containing histidine kinase [Cyanobacteria bacterium NC_groundwater_1444_Ag_S-0.65um_54_12]|nr:HAMP domain-containing histidine kinase [Cyanobacteria bacterium NC_groundwater_1444_Ag_S-0.65um_54_12]